MSSAADAVAALTERGQSLATAESLTGGLVSARIVDVPGASVVFRGGIVAYSADAKVDQLRVPPELIDAVGTVHPDVALAMAEGIRKVFGASYGLATTGVAGPGAHQGHRAGTAFVAVAGPNGARVEAVTASGDRSQVRNTAVDVVLSLLTATLGAKTR
jgi:nicotinamide-nucleotide amidase